MPRVSPRALLPNSAPSISNLQGTSNNEFSLAIETPPLYDHDDAADMELMPMVSKDAHQVSTTKLVRQSTLSMALNVRSFDFLGFPLVSCFHFLTNTE